MNKKQVNDYIHSQKRSYREGKLDKDQIFILDMNFPGWREEFGSVDDQFFQKADKFALWVKDQGRMPLNREKPWGPWLSNIRQAFYGNNLKLTWNQERTNYMDAIDIKWRGIDSLAEFIIKLYAVSMYVEEFGKFPNQKTKEGLFLSYIRKSSTGSQSNANWSDDKETWANIIIPGWKEKKPGKPSQTTNILKMLQDENILYKATSSKETEQENEY